MPLESLQILVCLTFAGVVAFIGDILIRPV